METIKNPFQYVADKKDENTKHDWYFEFADCECGPYHGRDLARKMLKKFKKEYTGFVSNILKKYHGGSPKFNIYVD